MSPVEILGTARCAAMNSACVPLPAPGGPTNTNLMGPPPLRNGSTIATVPRPPARTLRRSRHPRLTRRGALRMYSPFRRRTVRSPLAALSGLPQEPFVVALHQLALDLLDG